MKIKAILGLAAVAAMSVGLTACGSANYKDGTYTGVSSVYDMDESGVDGYGEVTITIENGQVTECVFNTYESDGTLKDEEYGKQDGEVKNQDYYNKAQKALAGSNEYAKLFLETGDYHSFDAISGATISYNQFMDAVDDALSQAEE
ncbi:MAG: FMN-binding protein [Lachnospiraceae bacterium]|nr:FMN-binding protein [Lachnospiraceae bacterium]